MHCPQCGQQQVSDSLRFCSRCGFPLEGVLHLLGSGGALPVYQPTGPREMSARRKGVRQGAALFLAGVVLVPVLGIFNSLIEGPNFDIIVALAAVIFFLGGLMRMLFAGLFEEGAPRSHQIVHTPYAPLPISQPGAHAPSALPPTQHNPLPAWRGRLNSAEVRQPSSVTENTTRLLDKDDSGNR